MIQLIHGNDTYLSYTYLNTLKEEYVKKGYEIKILNVDDTFEVPDITAIIGLLTEQDLFGSPVLVILKRITQADLFFKLGKALKTSQKLFDSIKISHNEIIIWEEKRLTLENPLSKLANQKHAFDSPQRDYEISSYISKNFSNIDSNIKKLILQDIKTTDTNEIASEIEKLKYVPQELLKSNTIVLTKHNPAWIISDAMIIYFSNPSYLTLEGVFKAIKDFDEDIRYKLAIIQNQISDCIYIKRARIDPKIKDIFFPSRRAFIYTKLLKNADKISNDLLFNLYKKSLIIEFYLNKGMIDEKVALQTIFSGDIKVMSLELLG